MMGQIGETFLVENMESKTESKGRNNDEKIQVQGKRDAL